ncbi:MAG TPA: hypothetical protein VL332_02040 [Candidatus Saccharimonadaceae bacterium]|jgi:hypothetical protein|nr:hypothetical protein [Candidatus Saccharimonadaceae bacterium]
MTGRGGRFPAALASARTYASKALESPAGMIVVGALAATVLLLLPGRNSVASGGAIAVLTLSVTQAFDILRRRSEERRWHADRFLEHKINSLRTLYGAITDWHRQLNVSGNFPPDTLEEFGTRVSAKEDAYNAAFAQAALYLEQDDLKAIDDAYGVHRRASFAIFAAVVAKTNPERRRKIPEAMAEFPWVEFVSTPDAATACLKRLLNPRSLRELDQRLGT